MSAPKPVVLFSCIWYNIIVKFSDLMYPGHLLQYALEAADRPQNEQGGSAPGRGNCPQYHDKAEEAALETLRKICGVLGVNIGDIVDLLPTAYIYLYDRSLLKMFDIEQRINSTDQENATKMIEYVKKAAEITHTAITANRKALKAVSAIQTPDKDRKWTVLQEYLNEYGEFIKETTLFTGLSIYPVNAAFYAEVNPQELDRQLQIIVGIVYLKEVVRAAINETYKECLKKLLKQSGLLTEAQLNLL